MDISGATNLTPEEREIANGPGLSVSKKPRQDVSGATNSSKPVVKMFGIDPSIFDTCITSATPTEYNMDCIYEKRFWKTELKNPENM
jgi:hypothetical protein